MARKFVQWLGRAGLVLTAVVSVSSASLAVPGDMATLDKKPAVAATTPWVSQCAADVCTLSHAIGVQDADAIHGAFVIDRKSAKVVVLTLDVPKDAEKVRGITIAFGKTPSPNDTASPIAPGTSVVLALSGCDDKKCSAEIQNAKIEVGKPQMYDVTAQFLKHGHFFVGFYRDGNFVSKSMPLTSFANDYAALLAKIKSGK